MPNRLIRETSPYLQQHAHNPVDWYPWGEEALEQARREDKPILLSIGYSACHWCHVMERESFENEDIARTMNQHFINIKVDREERPDLDSFYMEAVQALTGGGGWPLTVFLTPEGRPFYGGTYYPPEDRADMPGFPRVLLAVAEAYRSKHSDILGTGEKVVSYLRRSKVWQAAQEPLTADILRQAYQNLEQSFDAANGGFGDAPKFPQPMTGEFLLRYYLRSQQPTPLRIAELTLHKMAQGGIYDQLGGGFHRYATDAFWLVPHFEKMLYDNALLSSLYLHAHQVTGRPLYRRIAEETLNYVLQEMTAPGGGFYSSQDADSEGVEGKYYLWRPEEIRTILTQDEAHLLCRYYGVTEQGNLEGQNILSVPSDIETLARELRASPAELTAIIERAKVKLRAAREQRVRPGRDEKVVTSWNGLMLQAFAEAAHILGREEYRRAAAANGRFLLQELRPGGELQHTYKDGIAKVPAYLDDYALLIGGLLALHEATFDLRWLDEACSLTEVMVKRFWDREQGLFYDTGPEHQALPIRPRELWDSAKPCGGSAATYVLLRMAIITGESSYTTMAATALRSMPQLMVAAPANLGHWLGALDFYLSTPKEIAIIGPHRDPDTQALLAVLYKRYWPNRVLVAREPAASPGARQFPLLEGRTMLNNHTTVYICQNYACQRPVTEPEALEKQLLE